MATISISAGQRSARASTSASTVDTVNLPGGAFAQVYSDGAAALDVTFDGSTPTVGGSNTYPMPAGIASTIVVYCAASVKLVSPGIANYTVTIV